MFNYYIYTNHFPYEHTHMEASSFNTKQLLLLLQHVVDIFFLPFKQNTSFSFFIVLFFMSVFSVFYLNIFLAFLSPLLIAALALAPVDSSFACVSGFALNILPIFAPNADPDAAAD